MTNKTKASINESAIDKAKYELHMRRIAAIEEAAKNDTGGWYEQQAFIRGAQHVIEHPERYALTARKSLGIQEARELVNQMLAEEISFSRFVELINEGVRNDSERKDNSSVGINISRNT